MKNPEIPVTERPMVGDLEVIVPTGAIDSVGMWKINPAQSRTSLKNRELRVVYSPWTDWKIGKRRVVSDRKAILSSISHF